MKTSLVSILVTILALIAFQACQPSPISFVAKDYSYSELKAPLKGVEVAFETVEIDASQAKVVQLENGSVLNIPENAFVDKNGQPVKGKMKLSYRQFDDAADIIASGIPMTYQDPSGKGQQLESGGMFELKGAINGKAAYIAPGKSITAGLASETNGAYDFYYLDPEATEGEQAYNWNKMTNVVDDKPVGKLVGKDSFELKFDTTNYPELAPFIGIQWQLAQEDAVWNPKHDPTRLNATCDRVVFSQPQFKIKKEQDLITDEKNTDSYTLGASLDEKTFICNNNSKAFVYNNEGTLIKEITDLDSYYGTTVLSENLRLTEHKTQAILRDKDWNVIKAIDFHGSIYTHFDQSKERLICRSKVPAASQYKIRIYDSKGGELFQKDFSYGYDQLSRRWNFNLFEKDDAFFVSSDEGGQVLDLDGKLLATLKYKDDYESIRIEYSANKNPKNEMNYMIIIQKKDGSLLVWDWKKDKLYASKNIDVSRKKIEEKHHFAPYYSIHPTKNILTVREDGADCFKIWDCEKNTVKQQAGYAIYYYFSPTGNYKMYNTLDFKGRIETTAGKLILEYDASMAMGEAPPPLFFNKEETHFLLMMYNECKLYSMKGKLIRDFRKYDEDIRGAYFDIIKNEIITFKEDGTLIWWDLKGDIIREVLIDAQNFVLVPSQVQDAAFVTRSKKSYKEWSFEGKLLRDFGERSVISTPWENHYYGYYNEIYGEKKALYEMPKKGFLRKKESYNREKNYAEFSDFSVPNSDTNVYQLLIYQGEKEFRTYIYLDGPSKEAVKQYQELIRLRKLSEGQRRNTERKLLRAFSIQNFGIYNWDHFYKEDNEFLVKCAASVNFKMADDYSDITLFLITGTQRNTVIKYNASSMEKFSFNSNSYNKLIAILADNKIAIFNDEDFKGLDLDKIRSEKKCQFEMKIMGGVAALEELKKMTNVAT